MGPQVIPQKLGLPGGNSAQVRGTLSIWRQEKGRSSARRRSRGCGAGKCRMRLRFWDGRSTWLAGLGKGQ